MPYPSLRPLLACRYLLTDSRRLVSATDTVFFALKGQHQDGHLFIEALYKQGVRRFVTERPCPHLEGAIFYEVPSALRALQWLAAEHRRTFSYPVLGITGSNGKTIVKEWLYQLLEGDMRMVKSPKSYNSQLGVPLSVWEMGADHELGIFEAGISKRGEMAHLQEIIAPTVGIFTNIGPAHQEGFFSLEEKVAEKMKLFAQSKTLIYCADHPLIHAAAQSFKGERFSWGRSEHSQVCISGLHAAVSIDFDGTKWTLDLPFSDGASIENVMHCVAFLLHINMSPEEIQQRVRRLHRLGMRLSLKQGTHGCLLIDDTYSNDVAGLGVALDFMAQQDRQQPRTLVLSDFPEASEMSYTEAGKLAEANHIAKLIGIGPAIEENAHLFSVKEKTFFPDTASMLQAIGEEKQLFSNETILIKGGRAFGLERVVELLQQRMHGTRLEINLDALAHNFSFFRGMLKPGTKVMAMVKAFAYGSGSYEVARLLEYYRADYLAVAYPDEGVVLRKEHIKLPIMVMNCSPENFPTMLKFKLEPEIYSFRLLKAYTDFLGSLPAGTSIPPAHIKLDTGMHRLGFEAHDLPALLQCLQQYPFKIASVFTHLAGADEEAHSEFTQRQLQNFEAMAESLQQALGYPVLRHALNSPGIASFTDAQFDMVRLGIGLYGVEAAGKYQGKLRNVSTLKTTISQIRAVKAGDTVGYGRKGKILKDSMIAVIAIGYADGYDRRFSNGVGTIDVHGQLAPVIGNVCMDMTMIDVTGIACQEGDEVIVFGEQPSIIGMAQAIGTIPYEVLTHVNERVKRVFYRE